jgi:hypothetical protein
VETWVTPKEEQVSWEETRAGEERRRTAEARTVEKDFMVGENERKEEKEEKVEGKKKSGRRRRRRRSRRR